ncbi:MAG: hypothetical protein ACK4MT_08035 [Thermaurantiacus tibetensis]|uniref:hypothetical protein n=1 Tax=Thermaurantiacus tibetensis TaxID=2759035 RepID=UPI00188EBDF0|nr:hypothetical protein [Thermaurantiacus tibetensis]
MTKVVQFPHGARAAPAARLEMRWEATPGGLVCRWVEVAHPWFAPAAARPLARAPKPAPRRLAARLANRALARAAA